MCPAVIVHRKKQAWDPAIMSFSFLKTDEEFGIKINCKMQSSKNSIELSFCCYLQFVKEYAPKIVRGIEMIAKFFDDLKNR